MPKDKLNQNIELDKRDAAFTVLKPFCSFAKPNDYVEVTKWSNGEGYDIDLVRDHNLGSIRIQLSEGELEAIKACCKQLNKIQ